MRLEAGKTNIRWTVYHCRWMCILPRMKFVDDVTKQWGHYTYPLEVDPVTQELRVCVHKADEIKILPDKCLILIDPIGDSETSPLEAATVRQA